MKIIKKNLLWVTIGILLIGVCCLFFLKWSLLENKKIELDLEEPLLEEKEEKQEEKKETEEQEEIKKVFVDMKGAVQNPGVYEIEEGKKVIDVVGLAGGFTDSANTSLINLAKQVKNEMVIIIYTNEEVKQAMEEQTIEKVVDNQCICPQIKNDACLIKEEQEKIDNSQGQVNLNTASLEELQTLPGIGESKAQAIIEYRSKVGLFKTIEELKEVSGIGEALFEKVKDYITI